MRWSAVVRVVVERAHAAAAIMTTARIDAGTRVFISVSIMI
jgi:hypothetical protein